MTRVKAYKFYVLPTYKDKLRDVHRVPRGGGGDNVSHPDLRTNPNARIHVRQDQVTHMHRRSEYQNTM
jgi:hypothetical protein